MAEKHKVERSEWNMASATLMRMDDALNNCNRFSVRGDPFNWFQSLLCLEREVDCVMTPYEIKDVKKAREEISHKLQQWIQAQQRGINKSTSDLFFSLHDFEKLLRRAMKNHGIYMKESLDAGLAVTRG